MALLTKNDIALLADHQEETCISIFIPTHRAGDTSFRKKDSITLKNQVKAVTEKLESRGHQGRQIEEMLEPVEKLFEDAFFWNHLSDGLAIFLSDGFAKFFELPLEFEPFNAVADGFHLKPLLPFFSGEGRFFILALELGDVHFYEGTRHSISEVYIEDLTPGRLEERVGFDYEQKSLQFRSQGRGQAMFHGHGAAKDDRRNEIVRYFRAIDEGLMKMLHDETPPMVIASLDHLNAMYRDVNSYKPLLDTHIPGNPSDSDILLLHEKARQIVDPIFSASRRESIEQFGKAAETNRASADIFEIIPAAQDGKIDTLFLLKDSNIRGEFDPKSRKVEVNRNGDGTAHSLTNLAAVRTFLQGGSVYLVSEEEMPSENAEICALFRY